MAQGKLGDAVECYQRTLAIKPNYAEAHYNLGNALKDQGKLDDAVVSFERALALKPDYAEAHTNLGNILRDQGKLGDAAARYQRALALKPDFPEAHNNLGNALKDQGKFGDAVSALPARARPQARLCRGPQQSRQRARGSGQASATRWRSYQRALALKPDFADAHNNLGNVLGAQGKLGDAVATSSGRSPSSRTMPRPTTIWATRSRTRASSPKPS